MAKCPHDQEYEIGVDYMSVYRYARAADGSIRSDEEGDLGIYGTFSFQCFRCGFHRMYRSDGKRPMWLTERIRTLGVRALS